MPDWISHIFIGLIIAEIFNIEKKSLVVFGSLLPDFLSKIYLLAIFTTVNDSLIFVTRLFHSPVMGLMIPALITPVFKYNRKKTYFSIALGFMVHLLADSFTKGFIASILFYPLSHNYFSFNVFWAEQYWIVLIGSFVLYLLVKIYKRGDKP